MFTCSQNPCDAYSDIYSAINHPPGYIWQSICLYLYRYTWTSELLMVTTIYETCDGHSQAIIVSHHTYLPVIDLKSMPLTISRALACSWSNSFEPIQIFSITLISLRLPLPSDHGFCQRVTALKREGSNEMKHHVHWAQNLQSYSERKLTYIVRQPSHRRFISIPQTRVCALVPGRDENFLFELQTTTISSCLSQFVPRHLSLPANTTYRSQDLYSVWNIARRKAQLLIE